jgi:hypothetical protein
MKPIFYLTNYIPSDSLNMYGLDISGSDPGKEMSLPLPSNNQTGSATHHFQHTISKSYSLSELKAVVA